MPPRDLSPPAAPLRVFRRGRSARGARTSAVEDPAMPVVTFQVVEGVDRGRVFRDLPTTPAVTIGREEGNVVRLNDERVSRFHAKVQADSGEIILTDLESTNGTRVNGNVIQIRP